jgi:2-aminoadipate transaminase
VQTETLLSADARNLRPSAIRKFAAMMNDPSIISFAGGAPSPATFPAARIGHYAEKVIRDNAAVSLQYGPTRGLPALRESVAAICRERGFACDPATQLLMTTGSQQALYLVAATLLDPGDVVLVELPTYIGGAGAFYARRAELVGVAQDEEGIVPAALEEAAKRLKAEGRKVKFLYTIPNFQNPSGRVLAAERRRAVLEIATRYGFLVVEDDPYGELCFAEGLDTTPIKKHDDEERVIYLGSFSKVLSPGLRTGWVVGEPKLVRQFELTKESADLCSAMLDESIIAAFCAAGELPGQIASVRAFYRDRRDTLLGALDRHFTGHATWTKSNGGLFTFVTLDDGRDAAELMPRAVERGVAFVPGGAFFVDGSGANTMRLTFAKETDDRMREGIKRLAELFFPA